MKAINNALIRSFSPCYNPSRYVKDENETLPILKWVTKYRSKVPDKDIIWLLCHKEFMSDKDLRLFAVWCAREALKLVDKPDQRSVEACNVAERYANGEATEEELDDAADAAAAAARGKGARACNAVEAAWDAAWASAVEAARAAEREAGEASWEAAWATVRKKQLEYLIENCITK